MRSGGTKSAPAGASQGEAGMHSYEARVEWQRGDAEFTDNRYSRVHRWSFDGGTSVTASAAPTVVPAPWSSAEAIDPEEALVAATASCHMLWFLHLAARRKLMVERYTDRASGVLEKNAEGKFAITRITLRPEVVFSDDARPSAEDLQSLHHAAHDACYIANSLKSQVLIEPA
jgi:organic hydroperoxide reductase OsmC/OhrA